ncbi:MAG: family 16 glycosylhydrolase [Fibrobacteraceae bacterium]|nr:family 16 glycosylhydrolase [Fibrobacteraceae bacterium]
MNIKKISTALLLTAGSLFAKDYWGAELYTDETYQYGRFEARMQMAAESGLVSSMFLYHNDSYMGNGEPWVEVDIEVLGKAPGSFQSNIISGTAEKKVTSEKHHDVNPQANQSFHVYAMEWTDKYVAWFLDGVEVRKAEVGSTDTKNQVQALVKQQGLRFNIWSSESEAWVGAFDPNKLPLYQYIDWVKVYDYTPGSGDAGTGNNFKLRYADDFNGPALDIRWNTGDWTFDENRVDITSNNVAVKDGYAIIGITKAGQGVATATIPMPNDPNKGLDSNPQSIKANPSVGSSIKLGKNNSVVLQIAETGNVFYKVTNTRGEVVLKNSKTMSKGTHSVSLSKLPAGTYFMSVSQGNNTETMQLNIK